MKLAEKDKWFQIKAALSKGSLYFLSGENEKALTEYETALKLSQKAGDRQNESKAMVDAGTMLDMNREGKSKRVFQ
ncbi:MAG: hypothetical protein IPH11_10130 [Ignavibacteriales bacterium]|nr:hypothetical protein [Ignavibacteriales bacterium]